MVQNTCIPPQLPQLFACKPRTLRPCQPRLEDARWSMLSHCPAPQLRSLLGIQLKAQGSDQVQTHIGGSTRASHIACRWAACVIASIAKQLQRLLSTSEAQLHTAPTEPAAKCHPPAFWGMHGCTRTTCTSGRWCRCLRGWQIMHLAGEKSCLPFNTGLEAGKTRHAETRPQHLSPPPVSCARLPIQRCTTPSTA